MGRFSLRVIVSTGENMKKGKEKSQFQIGNQLQLEVYIEKGNSKKNICIEPNKTTVKEILKKLNILSSASIVTVNNEIATDDDVVKENDSVKILSVISGG